MSETMIIILLVVLCVFLVFEFICAWITYTKVGISGWKCLIPIYNIIVLFHLANIPNWMIILLFIPLVNLYPLYLIFIALAEHLGKSKTMGVLTIFFPYILFPIYAFTSSKVEHEYINYEEPTFSNNQSLMDGPIEALGARPDLGESEETTVASSLSPTPDTIKGIAQTSVVEEPLIYPEVTPEMANPSPTEDILNEPELAPLEPVVQIQIDDPLAAQQKVQYVEEEKEVFPDVNIYKTCPNCGNKVEPNATTCFLCGKRLDEENNQN